MATAITIRVPQFQWGDLRITEGVRHKVEQDDILNALVRHLSGNWGEVNESEWECNDTAVERGGRLHSIYSTREGVRFWVMTEPDRSRTTILLPEEY